MNESIDRSLGRSHQRYDAVSTALIFLISLNTPKCWPALDVFRFTAPKGMQNANNEQHVPRVAILATLP